jgi:hypothetical protein
MSTKRVVLADLGWCVGRLAIDENGRAQGLTIISPAETNPDRYAPAESVYIGGRESILDLKRFPDENLCVIEDNPSSVTSAESLNPPPVQVPE